ncbi:SRPBCC domain-containing protein [Paenibacillus sp. LHD-38]|uniref:SRPBCC domain-containing protein n=1 Tax=Paenibacillus sp. LHD-38 TaxID=3072143 RepID=UPI00280D1036|nr:SRPBCC domain-containing protein [Paenibacillus sp. LHD-38]MDQ8734634.1 SRPBCC domain-containing protein [Paenibacillus sp. LHD-38]
MEQVTVVCSIWISAMPERVWQAVTEGEQLTLWYSPGSPWEIKELKEGEIVYFHHSPNKYHSGSEVVTMQAVIESLDSCRRFALRWDLGVLEPAMITTFLLAAEKDGTQVTITETGYESDDQTKPTKEGYAMSLENLKALIEGRSLPY